MDSAWEGIFMLLVLKIPVVYLALVVWWAIRAEPVSDGGVPPDDGEGLRPLTPCGWNDWKRGRRSVSKRPRPAHPRPPMRSRSNTFSAGGAV
ncbi:MAG: hypothetical protein H0U82_08160 [Actinobacteria bacterium]|nr:hypothetical protein [Actinomycetota bacterium]